jgi:hypothetical protein
MLSLPLFEAELLRRYTYAVDFGSYMITMGDLAANWKWPNSLVAVVLFGFFPAALIGLNMLGIKVLSILFRA